MPRNITTKTTKTASAKPATKAAVKAAKTLPVVLPVVPAAPSVASEAKAAVKAVASTERADARAASRAAVAAFYAGKSLPFKAAADLPYKADLNPALQSKHTERTAALIAAILTYCDVQPDGSFRRGSGSVPGSLLGRTGADAAKLYAAGPESGCTSNMLGGQCAIVSGALGGKLAADTVLRLTNDAIVNLVEFNNDLGGGKRTFTAVLKLARAALDAKHFPALA